MEARSYIYRHRDYLNILRRRAGYTQRAAADALGISISLLQKLEYGIRMIPPRLLPALIDLYGRGIITYILRDTSTARYTLRGYTSDTRTRVRM